MVDYLKYTLLCLVIAIILQMLSVWLQSDFFETFIDANLITILIALLAINTTTIGLIATKLKELHDKHSLDFSRSIRAMKLSIIEQVMLIVLAGLFLLAKSSAVVQQQWPQASIVLGVLNLAVFIYSIHVLYDTSNGVFTILQAETGNES